MPYPELEPSPTFWRCASCANEGEFRASGTGNIACAACGRSWTAEQLIQAHSQAHASESSSPPPSG
jgi:hypothetical protein